MRSGLRQIVQLESIQPCPGRVVIFCGEVDRLTITMLQVRVKSHVYHLGQVYKEYKVLCLLRGFTHLQDPDKKSWAAAWGII